VSFSPDGKTLASASWDKTAILWNFDFENLQAEGCNWLKDYLVTHPRDLETLEVCQNPSILMAAAPFLVKEGEEQARQGNVKVAVATFRQALKWNPHINLDPEANAKQLAEASALVKKGEKLAQEGNIENAISEFQRALKIAPSLDFNPRTRAGQLAALALVMKGEELAQEVDVEGAIAKFQRALTLDSSLGFEPNTKARQLSASALVTKGESFANEGKIKEAIAAYTKAQKLDPTEISADSWNSLCWDGSLHGYPSDVMYACEKAVVLAPDNGSIRHSRGLARALTGNTKGAIEDFQAFIASTDDKKDKSQRQRWVNALRAGKNPFTPEEIKSLLNQ
jgi:tetratricopeptide (TPR) repeat protein